MASIVNAKTLRSLSKKREQEELAQEEARKKKCNEEEIRIMNEIFGKLPQKMVEAAKQGKYDLQVFIRYSNRRTILFDNKEEFENYLFPSDKFLENFLKRLDVFCKSNKFKWFASKGVRRSGGHLGDEEYFTGYCVSW